MPENAETIYALSSAPGRAGVAVVRISGPDAGAAFVAFTGLAADRSRLVRRVGLIDPASGERLDDSLVVWFAAPNSYTGEDTAEFHIHGGVAVPAAVLNALSRWPGLRMAEPGEYTKRAFHAGKLDLTEAEGIIDLIDAETEGQRRQALRQSKGALRHVYEAWGSRLATVLAHLEAEIDFPDEDLPESINDNETYQISLLIKEITQHLDDGRRGERLRSGLAIAIIGPPNAGKSSLLNTLARRDAAIVSTRAGTTRDIVEVHLDLGGFPVVLADTAGIRLAEDEIEQEGVRRALEAAARADLKIAIFDAAEPPPADLSYIDTDTIVVINKVDLAPVPAWVGTAGIQQLAISVKEDTGVSVLLEALQERVKDRIGLTESPVITRARHREAVVTCVDALQRSAAAALPELVAEDVRLAVRALGRITGRVDVEDILDIIFREFCIGK
jgi:tRNA modification GTPase